MAENLYIVANGALPTTAGLAPALTTVAVNVQLQLTVPSTRQINLVEYGISFSGSPAGAQIMLRQSSSSATLGGTCYTPQLYSPPGGPAALAATATFANSSTAVPPAATTNVIYDAQILSSNTYVKQFPLAREPVVAVSTYLQLVVTAGIIATATCYFVWRE